ARLEEIAALEGVNADAAVFSFIARRSQGGMRDAQSMLDRLIGFGFEKLELEAAQRVFGVVDRSFFVELSAAVFARDPQRCFELLDGAFEQSIDIRSFVADFLAHWRNLLLLSLSTKDYQRAAKLMDLSEVEFSQLTAQLNEDSSFDLQRLFDIAEQTVEQAMRSAFPRYVLEAGCAKMASLPSLRPLPSILAQLEQGGTVGGSGAPARAPAAATKAPAVASTGPAPRVIAPVGGEVRSTPTAVVETTGGEDRTADTFNPSWQEFLTHVKSRGATLLEVYLKRVSPLSFTQGSLRVEAGPFDLDALRDGQTHQALRDCLFSYSGQQRWDIQLQEHSGPRPEGANAPSRAARRVNGARKPSSHVPGSVAAQEEQAAVERTKRVIQEAREGELVQAALRTFQGSAIADVKTLPGPTGKE
ncbi:MAG: hypothetical protein KDD69_13005, partial [Bdellovibrionales bacterium]|nr:hypothetical protein [Bdellovibrionales bacterium]